MQGLHHGNLHQPGSSDHQRRHRRADRSLGKHSLGTGLNTLVGGVGGLVLGQLVSLITGTETATDLTLAALASNIIGGGVGGLVLTVVVSWIKQRMASK